MNPIDWVVIGIVVMMAVVAYVSACNRKRKGACAGGCSGCVLSEQCKSEKKEESDSCQG